MMFNLKTGQLEQQATGNNLWFSEDAICLESSVGYTAISADENVRLAVASFLEATYISCMTDCHNTDLDFNVGDYSYRLAVDENWYEDEPLLIYFICLPTCLNLMLDVDILLPLAHYLRNKDGE